MLGLVRFLASVSHEDRWLKVLLLKVSMIGECGMSPSPGDVIDHKGPGSPSIIGAGDGAKPLLPGGVPYLQLDLLSVDLDYPCPKLNANGMGTVSHELLLCELVEQAALAHSHITNNDIFEDIVVAIGRCTATGRHLYWIDE